MKKGFTLIELLAVIVILGIITLIAIPIIVNIVEDAKIGSYERQKEFIMDAAEIYLITNPDHVSWEDNEACISIRELIDEKLLTEGIKNHLTGNELLEEYPDAMVRITKTENEYEYKMILEEGQGEIFTIDRSAARKISLNNFAQGFYPSKTGNLTAIECNLYKYSTTSSDVKVDLYSSSNGKPDKLLGTVGTYYAADMDASYQWRRIELEDYIGVHEGNLYFLVFTNINGTGDYASPPAGPLYTEINSEEYSWDKLYNRGMVNNANVWEKTKLTIQYKTYVDGDIDLEYTPGAAQNIRALEGTWESQSFSVSYNQVLESLELYLYRYPDSESDIIVDLYTVDTITMLPDEFIVNLGSYNWQDIDSAYRWRILEITNSPILEAGKSYAIVYYSDAAYATTRIYQHFGTRTIYEWGIRSISNDGGISWLEDVNYNMIGLYGKWWKE